MQLKIGIIKEGKLPPDTRTPLAPEQCAFIKTYYPEIDIVVQPSPNRCFSDKEYAQAGITLSTDLSDCDILMGVKEVPIQLLIPHKTYFFFSHTIKKQPHNRKLLQTILENNIRLIDYEVLKDAQGERLIAFGIFAGMVGAHNGIWAYGERTGLFRLKRMYKCHDYEEALRLYSKTHFPPMKIVLTGTGRVATGAAKVLIDMGIRQVSPSDFLAKTPNYATFTQLYTSDYVERIDGKPFKRENFYKFPHKYKSSFAPFIKVADVMLNGIYWDTRSPVFFTIADMQRPDFKIQTIADITCDIAPESSIPSTLKASTIASPVFGFDPFTGEETEPFFPHTVDMMSIDNLPNELPRDASVFFGQQFIHNILGELVRPKSAIIDNATITQYGALTPPFDYLKDYVQENEEEMA